MKKVTTVLLVLATSLALAPAASAHNRAHHSAERAVHHRRLREVCDSPGWHIAGSPSGDNARGRDRDGLRG